MLEQPVQQDVQIAQLQEQIAALEQENGTLRVQLEACQRERGGQEQIAELKRQVAEQVSRGQTQVLVQTLTALAAEPDLDSFLGFMLQAIVEQLGDPSGGIWLYDETHQTTILHINYENGQIQRGAQITRPGSIHQITRHWDAAHIQLLREQRLLIQDVQQFPDTPENEPYRLHNQQQGTKMILVIPLFFGEVFLGNITLRSQKQRSYQPEELELARLLAHYTTLAIQLTRLIEQNRCSAIIEERNRMAREIHDTIAQGLTGIVVQLQAAEDPQTQLDDCKIHVQTARQLAKATLAEARRSVWALRPQVLEDSDLPKALARLVAQLTANIEITAHCEIQQAPYSLSPDVESHLLRIAQEALTNIIKHAQAHRLWIELAFGPTQVCLYIQDDGRGFQPEQVASGFGLTSMQERAQTINAHFQLTSQPGAGTVIKVIVPTVNPDRRLL